MSASLVRKSLQIVESPDFQGKQRSATTSSVSNRPSNNAGNKVMKKSKRKVQTFEELKKKYTNKQDKTQENLDKLKAFSESVVENTKATKFFKRASKLKEVEVEKVEEQTTIFTEEDFARFEREYCFD
ncbi:hypothetical protein LSTR_LSTR014912 [Laodelphax striatellus]|uniref:Uncharacterized protein n=1 Tax=Laodelphax striatellus TaxID=195883 RepID=A0A482WX59_LAOST|nr:hypothetical protein LSTR_LSTR014912 [Laodelphax striatellus]